MRRMTCFVLIFLLAATSVKAQQQVSEEQIRELRSVVNLKLVIALMQQTSNEKVVCSDKVLVKSVKAAVGAQVKQMRALLNEFNKKVFDAKAYNLLVPKAQEVESTTKQVLKKCKETTVGGP